MKTQYGSIPLRLDLENEGVSYESLFSISHVTDLSSTSPVMDAAAYCNSINSHCVCPPLITLNVITIVCILACMPIITCRLYFICLYLHLLQFTRHLSPSGGSL